MQCWPHKNERFVLISKRFKINSQIHYKKLRFRMNKETLIWMWTSITWWHILNDDFIKMGALPLFQLATRWNTQKPYETDIHNEFREINLYMNIGISNWIFWSIDPRKWRFCLYFSSIHDYWPPNTLNSLVHNSKCEMERSEKVAFQLIKIRKTNISRNINIKYETDFFLSVWCSRMKFILVIREWEHKSQTVT